MSRNFSRPIARPVAPSTHRHATVHSDSSASYISFPFSPDNLFTQLPPRPPRSPERATHDIGSVELIGDGLIVPHQPRQRTYSAGTSSSDPRGRQVRAKPSSPRARSLTRDGRVSSPSESSSSPHTPVATSYRRGHPRDSFMTQASGSTLYPAESITSGADTPPSPSSRILQVDTELSEDENYATQAGLDADDVAYRLRLLVRNNYFLPPAHSKPLPPVSPPPVVTPSKSPGLLGFFKPNKSKPPSPLASPRFPPVPPLVPGGQKAQVSSQPKSPPALRDRPVRVAVLRERVDDLGRAAMQAEREMKIKEAERRRDGSRSNRGRHLNDIDPTDTVDIDPSRPIPVLPAPELPKDEPAIPLTPEQQQEAIWRKDILHQAVGASLQHYLTATTPTPPVASAPKPAPVIPPPVPSLRKDAINAPIINQLRRPSSASDGAPHKRFVSERGPPRPLAVHRSTEPPRDTRLSHTTPRRAETPAEMRALAPPPSIRRNPTSPSSSEVYFPPAVRRVISNPVLSPGHMAVELTGRFGALTPRIPSPAPVVRNQDRGQMTPSHTTDSFTSGSHYSDEEGEYGGAARPSFATSSVPSSNRPSMTESHRSHFSTSFGPGPRASTSTYSSFGRFSTNEREPIPPVPSLMPRAPSPLGIKVEASSSQFFDQVEEQSRQSQSEEGSDTEEDRATIIYEEPLPGPPPMSRSAYSTPTSSTVHLPRGTSPYLGQASGSHISLGADSHSPSGSNSHLPQGSNPYLPSAGVPNPYQAPLAERSKGISNTPLPPPSPGFMKALMSRSRKNTRLPESTFDLLLSQQRQQLEGQQAGNQYESRSSDDHSRGHSGIHDESSKRLDGLLAQHIEAERDHLKRIASSSAVNLHEQMR